jgi:hypothetical protein
VTDLSAAQESRKAVINCKYPNSEQKNCVLLLRTCMELQGPKYEQTRLFASLAIANLTMSEDSGGDSNEEGNSEPSCKQMLLDMLGFDFFLKFPSDMISQRTAALCASEIMEEEQNQIAAFGQRKDQKQAARDGSAPLLRMLCRMTASKDAATRYFAIKALSLLSNFLLNRDILLNYGVAEIFYESLLPENLPKDDNLNHVSYAWNGIKLLAENKAELLRYALNGSNGAGGIQAASSLPRELFAFHNTSSASRQHIKVSAVVKRSCSYYFEFVAKADAAVEVGVAPVQWSPDRHDISRFGVDLRRAGCFHNAEFQRAPDQTFKGPQVVIGVQVELRSRQEHQCIVFTANGSELCKYAATSDWLAEGGLAVTIVLGAGESVSLNIGGSPFLFMPSNNTLSLSNVTALLRNVEERIAKCPDLHLFDQNVSDWRLVRPTDNIIDRSALINPDVLRHRAITWILFIQTLSSDEKSIFRSPIVLESDHPHSSLTSEKTIYRPGATMMDVEIDTLKFSLSLAAKEALLLYDSPHSSTVFAKLTGNDDVSGANATKQLLSDYLRVVWRASRGFKSLNNEAGWGYKISVTPKYSVPIAKESAADNSIFSVVKEVSPHNYLDNSDIKKHVEFPSTVEAICVVFDERSTTEANYDYLAFFFDEECTKPVPGAEKLSGNSFPGVGDNPPLLISANHFWYTFHSDGSNNFWGYEFQCSPAKSKISQLMSKPGAVRFESAHPYPSTSASPVRVSVGGLYHAKLEFTDKTLLSEDDVFEVFVQDPSQGGVAVASFTGSPPRTGLVAPATQFWVQISGSNASKAYGYDFVAYPHFDLFSAFLASPGAVQIETMHPYEDNMDASYEVDLSGIPVVDGKRKFHVVFDPRSCTENNYDYMCLYNSDPKSESKEKYGPEKLTGGLNGTPKQFPFEDTPLVIEHPDTDKIFATFNSDGSNHGWGVRFVAFNPDAVVQYDEEAQSKAIQSSLKVTQSDPSASEVISDSFKDDCLAAMLNLVRSNDECIRDLSASVICNITSQRSEDGAISDALLDAVIDMFIYQNVLI